MTLSKLAGGMAALLAVALAAGCGTDSLGGGGPPREPLQVAFGTDVYTGANDIFVSITAPYDVTPEMANAIAPNVRVANFPSGVVVPATQNVVNVPSTVTPQLVQVPARAEVWEQLDAGLDGNGWYAISVPPSANPSQYALVTEWWLFAFEDGRRGIRWSPTHPPVVSSVMSCHKDASVVGIIVRYSESVNKAADLPSVDYGATPAACTVSMDEPGETQFICAGDDAQPFSVHLPDGLTAQASGRPMAPATIDSIGMQVAAIPNDTCTIYKPLTLD